MICIALVCGPSFIAVSIISTVWCNLTGSGMDGSSIPFSGEGLLRVKNEFFVMQKF